MDAETASKLAEQVQSEVVEWRRHLHQNPELSFQEENTGNFIAQTLTRFGGIEVSRPVRHSVVGRIRGASGGRVIAIRADIDALPITEETELDYRSRNDGVMHACGHDGHTAMLLGTAKMLAGMKDSLKGEVRLLFQHAEELLPGGAQAMVDAGVMEDVDAVIGTHLWAPLPAGKIAISRGAMMAAPDTFEITIKGAGGHASQPHNVVDSIAIGSQVVSNLQHVVARNTDPMEQLVISVSTFHAGTAHNIIPGAVEICGTVRSFNPALRETIPGTMERIVRGVTAAHGADYTFDYQWGYRAVINDDDVNGILESSAKELFGQQAIDYQQKNMGGEDFSAFQAVAPGAFFYVGAGNEEKKAVYPHHHPKFAIDEDALVNGVKMFLLASDELLSGQSA